MVNQSIARYRIIERLGAGGMGEVYLAEDPSLARRVALKILPDQHTHDEERLRRFKQEAKAASALNHPNILTIHEVGEADGRHFIVTEFIDGESLRTRLNRGRMPVSDALSVAIQVASAMTAAHDAGIVHRDIKPENIMLRRDGYVKVVDFGLAKLTERAAPSSSGLSSPIALTQSGMVVGTVQYMSPEQATASLIDGRSDVFAFGAVLYEMLSGDRAFQGRTPTEALAALLTKEPAPLPANVPSELADIVVRCVQKDPARRFQSAAEVKAALESVKTRSPTGHEHRTPRMWRTAAVLSVLAVAGVFAWRALRQPENASPVTAVPLTALPGAVRYPSFSPDGDRVVFSWTGTDGRNPDIFVQQVGSPTQLRLTTDSASDFNPVWSPDGRTIAFLRSVSKAGQSEVRLIAALGGPERRLAELHPRGGTRVTPPYLTWCPDSQCLLVTDSPGADKPDALFVISLETGAKRQLTRPESPVEGDTHPAISPDGKWLVFRRMSGLFVGDLQRVRLTDGLNAAGVPESITPPEMDAQHPTWMPDSKRILFSAKGGLWMQHVAALGTPTRLPYVGEYGLMPVVSRRHGSETLRLTYVHSFLDFSIWRVRTSAAGAAATSPPAAAISSTRTESMPQLSPDGRRVAFSSDRSGNWEIWVADTSGANAQTVTSMGEVAGYPHWSPNGERLVFHSNLEGQWDVYTVPAAGGKPQNLTSHRAADDFPSFSRDGKWVYFSSSRQGEQHQSVWKVSSSGGDPIAVTKGAGYCPQESPDGAWLYFVESIDRPGTLWRQSASGSTPEKVLEGVYLGNFAVLDRGIYFVDRPTDEGSSHYVDLPAGETRLRYFDFASRRITTVARNIGTVDLPITASSDGRLIFYSRLDALINDLMLVDNFR